MFVSPTWLYVGGVCACIYVEDVSRVTGVSSLYLFANHPPVAQFFKTTGVFKGYGICHVCVECINTYYIDS